ncbi:MAG: hypothetical protein K6F50_08445, partial [Kiritimatiellae bacterium]|nr:hypothetical protein [Kiritimatiellia bacterium]
NNDPKLFVGRNRANELLNAVRGTITIEKVRDIITSVTATVDGMNASALRKSVTGVIAARVEARPRSEWPKWAQKMLHTEDQIKEWAKLTAQTITDRGEPAGGWGSLNIAAAVAEVDDTLSAAFAEVPEQNHNMFVKMVFDRGAGVLNKSSGGALKPREECVKVARQVKSLSDAAAGLVSESQVGNSKYFTVSNIARWCISQMADLFPTELFTKMAKLGLELEPNPLDDIHAGTPIGVIKQKMKDFASAVEKAMYKVLAEDKKAEDMVLKGGGQVRFELQNLVVSMAVTRYDWTNPGLRFGLNQVEAQDFMDNGSPTSPEEFSVQAIMQMVDQTLAEMGLTRDYHGNVG